MKPPAVEYHPEFLYFNRFVREKGCDPVKHPQVWAKPALGGGLSPYAICNLFLFDTYKDAKGRMTFPEAMVKLFERDRALQGLSFHVDVAGWVAYAKSLEIERMVERYAPHIFESLGTSFDLPRIKVSPVRLTPCPRNHFRALLSGAYDLHHVTAGDPPFYDLARDLIYLPIPEQRADLPHLWLDWTLIHELLHAAIRPLLAPGIAIEGQERVHKGVLNQAFGEALSNAGALSVLMRSGQLTRDKRSETAWRFLGPSQLHLDAVVRIHTVGFARVAQLFKPLFQISREAAFLTREGAKLSRLTEKQMRGILTKKYSYKKLVSGMDEEKLRLRLRRHHEARARSLVAQFEGLDVNRALARASAVEENPKRKVLLTELCELFKPGREDEWLKSGVMEERAWSNPGPLVSERG